MSDRIIVVVSGGLVDAIWSSREGISAEVLDYDNLEDRLANEDTLNESEREDKEFLQGLESEIKNRKNNELHQIY